jgi:TM2 domain-containing membrane protein YozV
MAFKSNCPHCQTQLDLERDWIGMEVDCPECGKSFTVRPPVVQKPIPSSVPEQPHYESPAPIPQYQQNMPPQYNHQQSPHYWQPMQYNAGENPFNFIFPAKYKLRGNLTFFNLLCPGLGHIYLGMVGKGFIFLFLMAALGTAFGFLLDEALSSAYEAIRIEDKIEYVLQHPEFNQRELKNIRSEIYRAKIYQRRSDEYRFFAMCCLPVFILLYCYIVADALYAMDKSCCGEPVKRWEFYNPFPVNRYISSQTGLITSLVSICTGLTIPGLALYTAFIFHHNLWHFFVFGEII